jgi:hypothetical protein
LSSTTAIQPPAVLPERWTLIAISAVAYVLAVAVHEHGGHATTCLLVGSRPVEMNAFYVNCDDTRLTDLTRRLVELAGASVEALLGLVAFALLATVRSGPATAYFLWLLGSITLMAAAGYPLFSGVTGLGDLGISVDGALHGASPQWLWRLVLSLSGALLYFAVVRLSLARLEPLLSGEGRARVTPARKTALVSYLVGAATYLVISAFNPLGWLIVLTSALPSSMGGTSGLLWMFQLADRQRSAQGPGLAFGRRWSWILAGLIVTLAYGLVFARSLRWPAAH